MVVSLHFVGCFRAPEGLVEGGQGGRRVQKRREEKRREEKEEEEEQGWWTVDTKKLATE